VGDALWTDTNVDAISRSPFRAGFRLRVQRGGQAPCDIHADTLILATPGHATVTLPFAAELGINLSELVAVDYPPLVSVALGVSARALGRPLDGFGFLVPSCEPGHVLGTLFTSAVFAGRAPRGFELLTSYVGGARHPELAQLSDPVLVALVLADLRRLLGVRGAPAFARVSRHAQSIPQYNVGFEHTIALLDVAEQRAPGLFIGGPLRGGASVGECIRAGLALAERTLMERRVRC
jgi:protoporphyrinogen/coproporphyrinogen III oxidase